MLCMERQSHGIEETVMEGLWRLIQLVRKGPKLSHIFFIDDLVLFSEASVGQTQVIKQCLDMFCDFWPAGEYGQDEDVLLKVCFGWA